MVTYQLNYEVHLPVGLYRPRFLQTYLSVPVFPEYAQSGGRRDGGCRNRCNRRPAGKRGWDYADNQYSARKELMFHVKHFCSTGGGFCFT